MKNILFWVCLLGSTLSTHAQYFRASMEVVGQDLIFYVRPNPGGGDIAVGWSGMEFFVRFPDNSPNFQWGTIVINTTDFPGITVTNNGNNIQGREDGYTNTWFGNSYLPVPIRTYTDGQIYEVFRVGIDRPGSDISFELVANEFFFPTYLALNGEVGQDLTAPVGNKFYGDNPITCVCPATNPFRNDVLAFPAVLPVELLRFEAKDSDEGVYLHWTATEVDFSHYQIERSVNGQQWETLQSIAGKGSPFEAKSYQFLDEQAWLLPAAGPQRYYRLRQVDVDESYTYSPVRIVTRMGETKWQVYPNPAADQVQLSWDSASGEQVHLYEVSGRLLGSWDLTEQDGNYTLNLTAFPAGSYWLQLERTDGVKEQSPLQLVR